MAVAVSASSIPRACCPVPAYPKYANLTTPSVEMSRLEGLRSRWTIPFLCVAGPADAKLGALCLLRQRRDAVQRADGGAGMGGGAERAAVPLATRPPTGGDSSAAFFTSGTKTEEPASYLPDGFVKRLEGRGLLVSSWAPQVKILGHPAVGGFLSNGGWNSTPESLVHGVAMVVWPLYAEQGMNAAMLGEELKVAVQVRTEGGLVKREEVERLARLLLEGDEGKAMKAKAADIREYFAKAVGEGGSSRSLLDQVVAKWKN